ncbi:hypothetical protein B0H19DRAFT_1080108 [Mycena capillaripes]|nr:hypothetical protein B0H19DRAFT_1080108 [Mycena capillaripes]
MLSRTVIPRINLSDGCQTRNESMESTGKKMASNPSHITQHNPRKRSLTSRCNRDNRSATTSRVLASREVMQWPLLPLLRTVYLQWVRQGRATSVTPPGGELGGGVGEAGGGKSAGQAPGGYGGYDALHC